MTTTFRRVRTVVGKNAITVDSLADYEDPDGEVTTVASCDIYDLTDGVITGITSYNIEIVAESSST